MKIHEFNQMMEYITRPSRTTPSEDKLAMAGAFKGGKKLIQNLIKKGTVKKGEAPKTDLGKIEKQVETDKRITKELAEEKQIPVKDETIVPEDVITVPEPFKEKYQQEFLAHDALYGRRSGDNKVDAEAIAETVADMQGKVYDDLGYTERINLYDKAYGYLSLLDRTKGAMKEKVGRTLQAEGGPIGFKNGGEVKQLKNLLETDRDLFVKKFADYANKNFSGNLLRASESIGESRNKIKAIYDRKGIKPPGSGTKIQTQAVAGGETPAEFSTKLKKQPDVLDAFKKQNVFADANELAAKFGVDVSDKRKRDTFVDYLNRAGVKKKNITGKINHYNIADAAKKLPKTFERKQVIGEGVSNKERLKFEQKLDKDLLNFRDRVKKEIRTASKDFGVYVPNAVEDVGHAVSLKQASKYPKLFKNSNTTSIQSLIFQDPDVNRNILQNQIESKYDSVYKELDSLVGKKVTPESRKKIIELNKKLSDIRKQTVSKINDLSKENKYFKGQEKRIPLIEVDIPKIGETFKSQDLKANMSVVDDYYRFGNINKINPTANKLSDLTPEQLNRFENNVIAQNSDNVQKYYLARGFPKQEVSELGEIVESRIGKTLKSEAIPGAKSLGEFVSSTVEDITRGRVLSPLLKGAGVAGLGYGIYDTGVGFKEGKSLPELGARFFGLDPLYQKGREYYSLSDAGKETQKRLNRERSSQVEDPMGLGSFDLQPADVPVTKEEKQILEDEYKDIQQKQAQKEAAVAASRSGIMDAIKAKINPGMTAYRSEFAEGGPSDPGRRKFFKIMGGLASLPILGKIAKPIAKAGPEAVEVISRTAEQMPTYLTMLINKVKNFGKSKILGKPDSPDGAMEYNLGDYTVIEGPGYTRVNKSNYGGFGDEVGIRNEIEMEIRKDPETGTIQYEEIEVYPDMDGKMRDVEEGVDDMFHEQMEKFAKSDD